MDKLIEFCQERYSEEIDHKLSLANIATWSTYITSTHIFYELHNKSIIDGLSNIKLKSFLDFSDGIIPSMTLTQLISSIIFILLISWCTKKLSSFLFYLFCLKEDFQSLIIDITLNLIPKEGKLDKVQLERNAKSAIDLGKRKLKRQNTYGEIFLAISGCSLLGLEFNSINISVSLISLTLFVITTWKSFHVFIECILPYDVAIRFSHGELTEFGQSFKENS